MVMNIKKKLLKLDWQEDREISKGMLPHRNASHRSVSRHAPYHIQTPCCHIAMLRIAQCHGMRRIIKQKSDYVFVSKLTYIVVFVLLHGLLLTHIFSCGGKHELDTVNLVYFGSTWVVVDGYDV